MAKVTVYYRQSADEPILVKTRRFIGDRLASRFFRNLFQKSSDGLFIEKPTLVSRFPIILAADLTSRVSKTSFRM